jgi:GTPase
MTVADIPGIVEGAHKNVGLGHSFLRHVERSKVLVFVIDLAGLDPARDLRILREELKAYNQQLSLKPSMIIANKADISFARYNLDALLKEAGDGVPVIPISAKECKNIETAMKTLRKIINV